MVGSLSPGLASALAGTQVQSRDQQKCINDLNKNFRKVAKIQGKEVVVCIREGARDMLGELTIEECTTRDRRGKVARTAAKTFTGAATKCKVKPDFGSTDPNTVNREAIALMLELVHELLGPDLDASIFPVGQASKCQEALAKQANRCADRMINEYNRCKKTQLKEQTVTSAEELQAACLGDAGVTGGIPDPKRLLRESCQADLNRVLRERCRDVDLGVVLPGSGLVFPFLSFLTQEYVTEDITEPEVDAAIIIVDALDACGNGLVEFPEECDDGNTANGDGCDETCGVEGECQDGITQGLEECDDGNDVECDGCSPGCTLEFCGDGVRCEADVDGDGILDPNDNCPFVANAGQEDDGGLDSVDPDGIGNTCQCGDVDGDGRVTSTDGTLISRCAQGLSPCSGGDPNDLPEPANGKCDVDGDGSCNSTDGTLVARNVMGLTPCASGVGNTNGVCDGATRTEEQLCVNAQPGAGGGGVSLNEECDDGNQVDDDGCSSECKLEVCGDGVLQPGIGENCDPPGSLCPDALGLCSDNCRCPVFIGELVTRSNIEGFCEGKGLAPEDVGKMCSEFVSHSDCPPGPRLGDPNNSARCIALSGAALNATLGSPAITFQLDGDFTLDCGAVDLITGTAPCTCDVENLEPVNLPGIGFVCFDSFGGCPEGQVDCDGGDPLDVTVITDHDVGADVVALDPDQFLVPFCGLLDPDNGNGECEAMCDVFCPSLEPAGSFVPILANCEGFCQGGPLDGETCGLDADCPLASCAGGDPVAHANACGCDCLQIGGNPSRPGAIQCSAGIQINVEQAAPCGEGIITIFLSPKCVPLTTERAFGRVLDADQNFDVLLPPSEKLLTGVPADCDDLVNHVGSGVSLVGEANFIDSNIGDLQVELRFTLE